MDLEPDGTTQAHYGQVVAGLQSLAEQQHQLYQQGQQHQQSLHALETRAASSESQQKRSDIPWPTYAAGPKENVRLWVHQMELAFEAHQTADNKKVVNAALCLKADAAQWYMSLAMQHGGKPHHSWSDFASDIVKRFEPKNLQLHLRKQLQGIKQDAAVREYIGRFQNVLSQVDGSMLEADRVTYFVDGLKPELRYELYKHAPPTLEAAIHLAEDIYNAMSTIQGQGFRARDATSFHTPSGTGPTMMEVDALERRDSNRNGDPPRLFRCYNCQGYGHIARNCPSRRRDNGRGRPWAPRQTQPRINALEAEQESGNGMRQ
jgi:hypothetical protein